MLQTRMHTHTFVTPPLMMPDVPNVCQHSIQDPLHLEQHEFLSLHRITTYNIAHNNGCVAPILCAPRPHRSTGLHMLCVATYMTNDVHMLVCNTHMSGNVSVLSWWLVDCGRRRFHLTTMHLSTAEPVQHERLCAASGGVV